MRTPVRGAVDPEGRESAKASLYAYLKAANETGFVIQMDQAMRKLSAPDREGWRKLDELPHDFVRKRLSILFEKDGHHVLIIKGALRQILEVYGR